jgi:hypothetical protein
MFADAGIIGLFFICYFFYAFYYIIKECISSFKQEYRKTENVESRKITGEMIQEAMNNRTFGDFTLTPAVVFFKDGDMVPSEGFKIEQQVMPGGYSYSRIVVSVSAEKVLDIFDEFVALLGDTCGVVMEDFRTDNGDHIDHFAYYKDTFIVRSILLDFEDLLLNDGFVGLAIWNEAVPAEVQLTRHKIIQVFARDTSPFQQVLAAFDIEENPELRFFFEHFYLLVSTEAGDSAVETLKDRLCIDHSVVQAGGPDMLCN